MSRRLLVQVIPADFPDGGSINNIEGHCVECGKPCFHHLMYVVRNAVWSAAGMNGWGSGFLHRKCLEKRLGRKLRDEEILIKPSKAGQGKFLVHPDYLMSPEYLEHLG